MAMYCVYISKPFLLTACNSDQKEDSQSKKTGGEKVSEVSSDKTNLLVYKY